MDTGQGHLVGYHYSAPIANAVDTETSDLPDVPHGLE